MNQGEATLTRWREALAAFERLHVLDEAARVRALDALRETQPALYASVRTLLRADREAAGQAFLEEGLHAAAPAILQAGASVGHYRLERELGHGGMGEVWLARRADGVSEAPVALKVLHTFMARSAIARERFVREGRILGQLAHPHIARLLDAGVTPEGLMYLALEHIEGDRIDRWCDARRLGIPARLRLVQQVCAALADAHAHLVVHRDVKPSNILVTADGTAKLLDFGIAKLVEDESGGLETELTRLGGRTLTPEYAAPEQITGGVITVATDVYAVGVLLYALLTGRRPYGSRGATAAQTEREVLETEPPPPSRARAGSADESPKNLAALRASTPAGLAKALQNDLDVIIGKAMKKASAERYPTIAALSEDLRRYLANEPVLAQADSPTYRARKFLRRNRAGVAAGAAVSLAIIVGIGATLWQAQRATQAAARATATRDFLISLFRANDPRYPADKPRDQLTAVDLLETGAARVEAEFADQPELQIELLYPITEAFGYLLDPRYGPMTDRLADKVRRYLGPRHPMMLKAMFEQLYSIPDSRDYAKGARLLDEADTLLAAQGLDGSLLRAEWLLLKDSAMRNSGEGTAAQRRDVLRRAAALYASLKPDDPNNAIVLRHLALLELRRGNYAQAEQQLGTVMALAKKSGNPRDDSIALLQFHHAEVLELLGRPADADALYQSAAARTLKVNASGYHLARSYAVHGVRARMWHRRGERARALALFDAVLPLSVPGDMEMNDAMLRETHGEALLAEGRIAQAVPLLEFAYRRHVERPYADTVARTGEKLGDAYDQAGRGAEARELLAAARASRLRDDPEGADPATLRSRERWARFLLDHSGPGDADFTEAETEFRAVLGKCSDQPWVEPALAHAGLSRLALRRGDAASALTESQRALAALERATVSYDVRVQPRLWLTHSAALKAGGDTAGARDWARKALEASLRYDDPSAASVRHARAAAK